MTTRKRKRLVRGTHWHGWAWQFNKANGGTLTYWANPFRIDKITEKDRRGSGHWVRVKYVVVK